MKDNARHEYYIDFKWREMRVANTMNANMKLYIQILVFNIWRI